MNMRPWRLVGARKPSVPRRWPTVAMQRNAGWAANGSDRRTARWCIDSMAVEGSTPVASGDAYPRRRQNRNTLNKNDFIRNKPYASRMQTHTSLWITLN